MLQKIRKMLPELDFETTKNNKLYFNWSSKKYYTYEKFWYETLDDEITYETKETLENVSFTDSTMLVVGSGKGCSLFSFIVEDWNFKKVFGIEIEKEYIKVFRKNEQILLDKQIISKQSTIINDNIKNYEIPKEVNFLFLFNPFGPKTMKVFTSNLVDSMNKNPREVYILYRNAIHRDILLETKRFEIIYHYPEEKYKYFILKGK